jgi:hypothetical protein
MIAPLVHASLLSVLIDVDDILRFLCADFGRVMVSWGLRDSVQVNRISLLFLWHKELCYVLIE